MIDNDASDHAVAIIGMACRFPGATTPERFWRNLIDGVDSVRMLGPEELGGRGVPAELIEDPSYVWATGELADVDGFDAAFFGISPREAELMDPQHRLFLETCWAALEDAAYPPRTDLGVVGVFGGVAMNKYLVRNLLGHTGSGLAGWDIGIPAGSSPDSMPARVSYHLGLTGPSLAVQTACSSGLSAVCLAADAVVSRTCDLAVAGASAVELPDLPGYQPIRGLLSSDGRCRPYDAAATGSVFGSGVGVVVVKSLARARADGDHIHAVLRGWAMTNDGRHRAGYAAPGVAGQSAAIVAAMTAAQLRPDEVHYVEGHGSATPVGDAIEVRALSDAYSRLGGRLDRRCLLGSVKGHIGHLDAAAGVAGLIKTVLSLQHGAIPPTLHYQSANPGIDFASAPVEVSGAPSPWPSNVTRRGAVSSFGMGGSNAHVVVEQAPPVPAPARSVPYGLMLLSAATPTALTSMRTEMSAWLRDPRHDFESICHTLAVGRTSMRYRCALVAGDHAEAADILSGASSGELFDGAADDSAESGVVFMFPGVGDAYADVTADLYRFAEVFRREVDQCAEILRPILGADLREHLYPTGRHLDPWDSAAVEGEDRDSMSAPGWSVDEHGHARTKFDQPAVFVVEYALAQQFMAWGVEPSAMIGHSVGEYVAACLAGVFSLPDALQVVAQRATLIGALPRGGMLAVPRSEQQVQPLLRQGLAVGAVNAPALVVLSGLDEALDEVAATLREEGTPTLRVRAEHPFHTDLVAEICPQISALLDEIELRAPTIPYVSGVTGTWITDSEATSTDYWTRHMCRTVRFCDGVATAALPGHTLLEVGVGQTLTSFAATTLRHRRSSDGHELIASLPSTASGESALRHLLQALGRLWVRGEGSGNGASLDGGRRQRVPLPTYPFERHRYWVDPPVAAPSSPAPLSSAGSTDLPQILINLWRDLLGHQDIDTDSDFLHLGGHSLLALQMADRLWREHGIEIAVADLVRHRTLGAVAQHLTVRDAASTPGDGPAVASDRSQVTAPESIPETALLERIRAAAAAALGVVPDDDAPLTVQANADLGVELAARMRREFGIPFYPSEFEHLSSVRSLTGYAAAQLQAWRRQRDRSGIPPLAHSDAGPTGRVAFILSSPRSGSTMLRTMLAGHPDLFCPPELHLLGAATMGHRRESERGRSRNQGVVRALMELIGADEATATEQVREWEDNDAATGMVFAALADRAAPRMFIDKSPGYSRDLQTLHAIADYAPHARFIHLTRHPVAVVDSIISNRFTQLMGAGDWDPADFGEHVWQRYNDNITRFMADQNPDRCCRVRYEDLVRSPEPVMRQICRMLEVDYSPTVLTPYEGNRMRDGLGDPNFLTHTSIDARGADSWQTITLHHPLTATTTALATELGYPPAPAASTRGAL